MEHYQPLLERKGGAIFQARPVRDNVPEYFLEWLQRLNLKPKELGAKLRLSQELGFEAVMQGQTTEVQVPVQEILFRSPYSILPHMMPFAAPQKGGKCMDFPLLSTLCRLHHFLICCLDNGALNVAITRTLYIKTLCS